MRRHPEPTRTRDGGRQITQSATPDERIAAVRRIVTDRAFAKIDGCAVDLFTASAIIAVYDALNDANRIMFAAFDVPKMARVALRLAGK